MNKPRCPELSTIPAGDESMDVCCIAGKMCLLVSGNECDIYNEFLAKCDADHDNGHHDLVETGI